MSYQQIIVHIKDYIATITLNRPEQLNAWTDVMASEVYDAMWRASDDDNVRVIILTGAGRAFCAGGDVTAFKTSNPRELLDKLPRPYDFSRRPDYQSRAAYFPAIKKPIIAMVNGAAVGLGLVHALFCDVRFAADNATLGTAFARIGLASEYGMGWILNRVVGHANALDLLLSARKVRGAEALRLGLVQQIYPAEELANATHTYAREMATLVSPRSARVIKQQLWQLPFQSLHEALLTDSDEMLRANVSEDFAEGKRAFMEKRDPKFTGQ